MFHIIEHFCLGRRRLQLFGRDSTVRPGWLTLGPDLTTSNYDAALYNSYFADGNLTTGCTDRIESLRPKSPPPKVGGRGREEVEAEVEVTCEVGIAAECNWRSYYC